MASTILALAAWLVASARLPDSTAEIDALVSQLRASRQAIGAAHLEWTKSTEERGFARPGREFETVSRYTCNLAGETLRIEAREEVVVAGPDRAESVGCFRAVSCWDGRLFTVRRGEGDRLSDFGVALRPDFPLDHNLLGLVFRNPAGDADSILPERVAPAPPPGATREVSWVEFDGEPTLRIAYSSCAGRWVLHYAIERGGYLIAEDLYDGEFHSVETRTRLSTDLGDWFPSVITSRSFGRDGTVTLMHRWELDLANSALNPPVIDDVGAGCERTEAARLTLSGAD